MAQSPGLYAIFSGGRIAASVTISQPGNYYVSLVLDDLTDVTAFGLEVLEVGLLSPNLVDETVLSHVNTI